MATVTSTTARERVSVDGDAATPLPELLGAAVRRVLEAAGAGVHGPDAAVVVRQAYTDAGTAYDVEATVNRPLP